MIRIYKETLMLLTFLLAWMRYNGYTIEGVFRDMANSGTYNRSLRSYFEKWGQLGGFVVDKTAHTFGRDGGKLTEETFETAMEQLKQDSEGVSPDYADLINQMVRSLQYPFMRNSLTEAMPQLRRALLVQEEMKAFAENIRKVGNCYACSKKLQAAEMVTYLPNAGGEPALGCSRCYKPEVRACEFCATGMIDVRPDDRFKNKRSCGCQKADKDEKEKAVGGDGGAAAADILRRLRTAGEQVRQMPPRPTAAQVRRRPANFNPFLDDAAPARPLHTLADNNLVTLTPDGGFIVTATQPPGGIINTNDGGGN